MVVATISTNSMISFTTYDSIKGIIEHVFASSQQLNDISEESSGMIQQVKDTCKSLGDEEFSINLDAENEIKISCSDINKIQSADVSDIVSTVVADNVYNREYDCDFISCISEGESLFPMIFTRHANNFYKEALTYMMAATVALGILLIFLANGIRDKLRSIGFPLLWSGVPFIVISFFMGNIVSAFVPREIAELSIPVIENLISADLPIYMGMVAAGLSAVIASYLIGRKTSKKRD